MTTYTSDLNRYAGIDTYIDDANTSTNFGSDNGILIGTANPLGIEKFRGLLKFDLSQGTNPPHSYVTVQSATLTLTPISDASANNRTLAAYRVKRNWVESQATWNIYSTGNNWGTAGCSNTTTDRESTAIGTVSISASQTLNVGVDMALDATAVQEWISGSVANYGILLKVTTESPLDMFTYASSEHATSTYRPKLVIEYTTNEYYGQILMSMYERT